MPVPEESRSAERRPDDLARRVLRRWGLGSGPGIRPPRAAPERLRERPAPCPLAAAHPPGGGQGGRHPTTRPVTGADPAAGAPPGMVDTPWDRVRWADAEDEGRGARHGPGPA